MAERGGTLIQATQQNLPSVWDPHIVFNAQLYLKRFSL